MPVYPADLATATRVVFAAPHSVPHQLRCALFLCAIPQPVFPANSAPTAIRPAAPKCVFVQLRSAPILRATMYLVPQHFCNPDALNSNSETIFRYFAPENRLPSWQIENIQIAIDTCPFYTWLRWILLGCGNWRRDFGVAEPTRTAMLAAAPHSIPVQICRAQILGATA